MDTWPGLVPGFRFGHESGCRNADHPDDMALTWTRADVADDVSRAHGQIRVVRVGSVRVNGQLGDVVFTRRHC